MVDRSPRANARSSPSCVPGISTWRNRVECPPGYSYRNARQDSDRLHQLHCKRLSPRSAGGGGLTAAEDDEEALLTAWSAAYWQSPDGRERKRLEELEFRRFSRCPFNDEEQNELNALRKK